MFIKKIIVSLLLLVSLVAGPATGTTLTNDDGKEVPVIIKVFQSDNKAPTVLVSHGSAGVSDFNYQMGRDLQKWGYNAVVIDHYTKRGITRHSGRVVAGGSPDERAKDFIDVANWVKTQPWHSGKIAVVGFSQGGSGVLALADTESMERKNFISEASPNPISVGVAFYPACFFQATPANPGFPVQLHMGGDDEWAGNGWCYNSAQPGYELNMYKGATHAWDADIPSRVALKHKHKYNAELKNESRRNVRKFLDKHLQD